MITSITLQGFKSFAERTRLEFGPGITAVIGPNGSGKSNVVEALRWVSHQARARELRAARATELIFHGSAGDGPGRRAGKSPLGLAEVQVELRTHLGERLHLSRRIYRDGSAEQDIMGRAARARDVQGALRGTGLGSGGLAVIGQGEVGSVVGAEGQTLLAYVQEAAGLSRSVAARQDTEAQLKMAEAQLAQVRLLEDELGGRVQRLHQAATAAEQHRRLTLETLSLQDALARARHLAALEELGALRVRADGLATESAVLTVSVQESAAALELARGQVAAAREQGQAHAQTLELFRAAERGEQQARATLDHLNRDLAAVVREQQELQLTEPVQPPPNLENLQTSLAAAARSQASLVRQARELEARLRQAQQQSSQAAQQQAARSAQYQTLRAEAELVARQLAGESAALEALRAEQKRLGEVESGLQDVHAEVVTRHAALLERERALRAAVQQVTAELPPLRREQERLEASLNGYARYAEGPRNALRSDHPGILGSVADLLTVPAEHETAVGAALGRRLEQVVVQTADDAREIIDLLKRSGGRATFLPLDLLRPRPRRDAALLHEPGVIGNLSDLCPSDPPIVGQNLLSDTLLMSSLQAATALARRHASRPRLVTADGEVLEPGGALTGGRLRDNGAGVLADQRRFAELQDELEALETRASRSKAELITITGDAEDSAISESVARAARDQARQRAREAALQLAALEARTSSLVGQHQALTDRLAAAEQNDSVSQAPELLDPGALEQQLTEVRAQVDQAEQQERQLTSELAVAREVQSAWKDYRAALLRHEKLQVRTSELEGRVQSVQSECARMQVETSRLHALLGTLTPHDLPAAEARRDQASQAYSNLIARQNRVAGQLEEARLTLARREGSLTGIADGVLPVGQPRDWQQQLGHAQGALDALGTVNLAAADELRSEQDRLQALGSERQDVDDAVTDLLEHLAELGQTEQLATASALERVATGFAEYSAELLGGEGELERERDGQGRLIGLRLAVQPKGKRTRSLTLLSAGERTMAGLAFLFALSHAPAESVTQEAGLPLAVLDEVDAPLDEANIRRFTRFLTVFAARGSQFVLVTHQKATMEVASAIWGVTTDATGASRVLSIRQMEELQIKRTV